MHQQLKVLSLVTATLLLSLTPPLEQTKTSVGISDTLAQEATTQDRQVEAERLEGQLREVLSNLTLRIGLDPSLGNDMTEAKQALEAIAYIETLSRQQDEAQYILGRVTDAYRREWQKQQLTNLPVIGSVGLFSSKFEPIPGSFGATGETVNDTINRLRSNLKSLQLARVVTSTSIANLPQLNVAISMQVVGKKDEIIANSLTPHRLTQEDTQPTQRVQAPSPNPYKIQGGERFQLRITNNEPRIVYLTVLAIDPAEEVMVLFPNRVQRARDAIQLKPNQTLLIPDPAQDEFKLSAKGKGVSEIVIVASSAPLVGVRLDLQNRASQERQTTESVISDDNQMEVVGDFIDTFDQGTGASRGGSFPRRGRVVPVVDTTISTKSAVMSITLEIVDKPDS
ncbi:MAG: DUF4384 domain-containing protein [Cyanobacteriota bacterium]